MCWPRAGRHFPATPISDVQPWQYSGNHSHPAEKGVGTLQPVNDGFTPSPLVAGDFNGDGILDLATSSTVTAL
jgi:hypothetical protein